MEALALYLLLGAFAGVLAGLLGVGGGLVIVPVLVAIFGSLQFPSHLIMHLAIGTSLGTIIVTSISSVLAHHRHGAVQWLVFARLMPGILVGALSGAWLAHFMPTDSLRIFFGVFELVVAVQMGFALLPDAHTRLPGRLGLGIAGGVIGAISAIVGIGGGTMTVPYLVWSSVGMRQAVATSAATGLPIAIAGAIGFLWSGWGVADLPEWSSGYLYWPALLGIVAASALTAPLGARLAHSLPVQQLKRFFALFLALLGIRMLWMAG